ncbi:MAG: cysteine dioxygenase [Leptolyngbya sp. SIO3F4]|nr:cysteine dioxygenase [Leptolyngbya sp. SIO3F4]
MVQAAPVKASVSVDTYPTSLQRLIHILQQTPDFTPEQIATMVGDANVSVQDLLPWADLNHPISDSYGRQLVFNGGYFEIMVMSWLPGDFSAIHDHGATQWGAVQCFGAAEHYIYTFKQGGLCTLEPAHYSPGMVHAVDHSLIHQMGNPGNEPFLSLHVYGCQGAKGSITGNARIFDLFEGSIQYTDGGVFFGLPEDQINLKRYGLEADRETTLRHHQLMCDRIQRILKTQQNDDLNHTLTLLQQQIQQLSL